jgi:hypothetical protein
MSVVGYGPFYQYSYIIGGPTPTPVPESCVNGIGAAGVVINQIDWLDVVGGISFGTGQHVQALQVGQSALGPSTPNGVSLDFVPSGVSAPGVSLGDCCLISSGVLTSWAVVGGSPVVNSLRYAVTDGATASVSATEIATDCESPGPIMSTDATTMYGLYVSSSTLGTNIVKVANLTTTPTIVTNTVTATNFVAPIRGGLAQIGGTLCAVLRSPSNNQFTGTLQVYTSINDGVTWTAGATLPSAGTVGTAAMQFYSVNGVTVWAVAYKNTTDGNVHFAISRDNGATWSDSVVGTPTGTVDGLSVYVSTSSHFIVQWANGGTQSAPVAFESYDTLSWTALSWSTRLPPSYPPPTNSYKYIGLSRMINSVNLSTGGLDGNIGGSFFVATIDASSTGFNLGADFTQSAQMLTTEINYNPDDFVSSTSAGGVAQTETIEYAATSAGGVAQTETIEYAATSAGGVAQTELVPYTSTGAGGAAQTDLVTYTSTGAGGPAQTDTIPYISTGAGGPAQTYQFVVQVLGEVVLGSSVDGEIVSGNTVSGEDA